MCDSYYDDLYDFNLNSGSSKGCGGSVGKIKKKK